jgi:hypothetical protein
MPLSSTSQMASVFEPVHKLHVLLVLPRSEHSSKKLTPIPELEECNSQSSSFSISVDNDKSPISEVTFVKAVQTYTFYDKNPSEVEAENLLVDIYNARYDQLAHVAKLEKDIRDQMEFGVTCQMMGGCSDESEAYLQRANRLRRRLEVTLTVIAVLNMHILTLESEIHEAQSAHRSADFSEQENFAQEIKSILLSGTLD